MKILIAQINYDSANIQGHVLRLKRIIEEHRSYDLIVFPELILQGHPSFERPEGFLYRKMKTVYGAVAGDVYRFIKKVGARVIIGELRRRADRYYNTAAYVDRSIVQTYVKTHVHWTENFTPGARLKTFETPFGKIGINICFDSAFSEVWRFASLEGAELAVNISAVPASFPVRYMWRRMQGAAVFNQYHVIYANRPGDHFSGHSAVFGPTGEILAAAGPGQELLSLEIDSTEARAWREEEILFPNRRPLLYRNLTRRTANTSPVDTVYLDPDPVRSAGDAA